MTAIVLPKTRLDRLIELGLVSVEGNIIHYIVPNYRDNLVDFEEQVRADLYLDLIEKYHYGGENLITMEKYHKIGHPHKKSDAKIDLLVNYPDQSPFMVIELKSPSEYEIYMESSIQTQLFNVAAVENQGQNTIKYLIYYTRYWEDDVLQEKIICIDYKKYSSFDTWDASGRPNLRAIPLDYGIVRVPKYIKGGEFDLRTDVKRDELQRIRKDLHNILWGGGKYQNELFFNLVGLFLVKIYDEKETIANEAYNFQVFFEDGEPESSQSVYDRLNEKYFRALKEYLGYDDIQLRKIKDIAFDAQKVRYVVEVLQGISFTANKFDVIGDFFEGIVRGEFKQSKGQYLTHTNLIRFMVKGVRADELAIKLINNEKRLPYIIDPSCGSGAFLIEAMKQITTYVLNNKNRVRRSDAVSDFIRQSFPEYRQNAWAKYFIYGIEINGDLAAATKVNMVGHGDGSANIEAKDALLSFDKFSLGLLQISRNNAIYPKPVNEQFDIILSNPPFSVTVDRDTAKTFPGNYIQGHEIWERLKGNNELEVATELLFIERYYQLLRPLGRLAVVLPESVFDTSSTRNVRLFLFKHFRILGIISLTVEAFSPYTTTKTNILFGQKKTDEEITEWDEIWIAYQEQYRTIREGLDKFFAVPTLVKKTHEIFASFTDQEKVILDDKYKEETVHSLLTYIREYKGEKLEEDVANKLYESIEDITEEQKAHLLRIIQRKKSYPKSIFEYYKLIRSKQELIALLKELLGDLFDPTNEEYSLEQLTTEYAEEYNYADEEWWVFKQVATKLGNYNIVLSHAEDVGYKRGVRGEENRPNELYKLTLDGNIEINTKLPETILDEFLANISWQ